MKKYMLLLCLIVTAKNYSQEFYVSYNISYKKDMEKIKMSFTKVMGSYADQMIAKDKDTSNIKQRKAVFLDMTLKLMMPEKLGELSNKKWVSLVINDSLLIEKETDINDSKSEKTLKISELKEYYTEKSKLISIREDIKDTKIIKGYKCHKVYLNVIEQPELPEMSFTIYEMYVTDNIKKLYHPIIRFKSVLEKYYPMEITIHIKAYNGFEINYTLNELKL